MRKTPPIGAALALGAVKTLILLGVLALGFGFVSGDPTRTDRSATMLDRVPSAQPSSPVVAEAIRRHDCSMVGFGAGVEPRSALVRRDGKLHHVSFDEGWAVFTGEQPGELIAVCLTDR